MKTLDSLKETKIKRKNFLYLAGFLAAGAFIVSKVPASLFRSRTDGQESGITKLKPVINPDAVKRNAEHGKKMKGV